ncbi:MAG: SIMPL domain-containing protein [Candidatus Binataceae bacterium]|nr:SIMPL domain-containing protein [Candidatus Binataceae bacterium]
MKPNGLNAARPIRIRGVARSILIAFALAVITLAAIALPGGAAAATDSGASGQRTIQVSGNGEVQAAPDFAVLSLAIETHAATAAEAAGRNGALAQKVGAALKAKLGDNGKTWTGGYSLYPEYSDDNRPNAKPTVTGYQAANSITVETGALDLVGPLIDAAIAAGANRINSLDFNLRNDTLPRNQAIAKAAKDAQAQAQALADALGVKLGPIVSATTISESRPEPMMARMATMAVGSSTPVQAGEVTVPATVSLTYQIE